MLGRGQRASKKRRKPSGFLALLALAALSSGCASNQYMGISLKPGDGDPVAQALAAKAQSGDKQSQYELGRWFEDSTDPNGLKKAIKLYRIAATPRGGTRLLYTPGASGVTTSVVSAGPRIEGYGLADRRISALTLGGVHSGKLGAWPRSFGEAGYQSSEKLNSLLQLCDESNSDKDSCPTANGKLLVQAAQYHITFPLCLGRLQAKSSNQIDIDSFDGYERYSQEIRGCMVGEAATMHTRLSQIRVREIWLSAYMAARAQGRDDSTEGLTAELLNSSDFEKQNWDETSSILGRALDTSTWPHTNVIHSGIGWNWWENACFRLRNEDKMPISEFESAMCLAIDATRTALTLKEKGLR